MESLTRDKFNEQINTKFQIYFSPDKPVETELIEVSELVSRPRQESFSLVFRAPPDVEAGQGNYKTEHQSMGEFALFLVPMGNSEKGAEFEAVFNRLLEHS